MLTITRKDLLLTINDNVIPALGSSDVPVKFVNDTETYVDFLIEPRVGYYINGCPKSTVCEYDTYSNIIKIPAEAFKQRGVLVIAIALIDNDDSNHIEVTKELALEVTQAPDGTVILPAAETWQNAVNNLVEQLYNQDYKPLYDQALEDINEAVETANTASDNANLASQNVQTAYENLGDYKVENGVIYFKKADGTYNEQGITLAGQSSVLDGNGNVILSGNITPNDNLLTNSDFRSGIINQKGLSQYDPVSKWTLCIDGWLYNGQMQVFVQKNQIGLYSTSNNTGLAYFKQKMSGLKNGNYIAYVHVVSLSGSAKITLDDGTDIALKQGDNFVKTKVTENLKELQISLNGKGVNLFIDQIKFEPGEYFTGMPAWNYGVEFLKCAHIYMNFYGQSIRRVGFIGANMAYITYELPTSMVEDISCVIRANTVMVWQNDNTASTKNTTITSAQVVARQGNAITVQFKGDFGNSSWRVCYVTGVGIEFDGYQY